jgi:ABC-2 type transport system ATP-binding protein
VFAGLPAVDGRQQGGPATHILTVSHSTAAAPAVTRALVAGGADVVSISESRHSLDEVYLKPLDEDDEVRGG